MPHRSIRRAIDATASRGHRDFLFLDQYVVDRITDQLCGVPSQGLPSNPISLPPGGSGCGRLPPEAGPDDKVAFLLHEARLLTVLFTIRPKHIADPVSPRGHLVHETCEATPLTLSGAAIAPSRGIDSLRLWISDPDPADLARAAGKPSGSMLLLCEVRFDNLTTSYVQPGCSALRFVVNGITGRRLLDNSGPALHGGDDPAHPIDALLALGAVRGEPRRIETLYRIRYMTSEQGYLHDGAQRRMHDILGYPLFIAAA